LLPTANVAGALLVMNGQRGRISKSAAS